MKSVVKEMATACESITYGWWMSVNLLMSLSDRLCEHSRTVSCKHINDGESVYDCVLVTVHAAHQGL